jgi:putative ABC transport system permease protein
MRLYRVLLRLYPASFRHEYGGDMSAIFARRRREASGLGVLWLWLEAIADVVSTAAAGHADIFRSDVKYATRTFARAPGFAMAAILIVSLGIGATTAAFSVTDFVLIRPLPFADADRLVNVFESHPGIVKMELSPANYRDLKQAATSFEVFGAYRGLEANLVGRGEPQRLEGAAVTADLLATLGVTPVAGRLFTADDDREDAPATLILSYRLWQTTFGGDESAIGRTVMLDNLPYTIVGVMPPAFYFPFRDSQMWAPMRFQAIEFQDRNDNYLETVARLRRGVSLAQARAELNVIAAQLKQQYPKENVHTDLTAFMLRDQISQSAGTVLLALSGAALCVLLIACANLANLLLARGVARTRELAVRTAMGAGRERLVRQLLTESALLAAGGGLLGVALARGAMPLLSQLVPNRLPLAGAPALDLRVLIFAGVMTAATAILFGMAPILRASRDADLAGLRDTVRAGGGPKERIRSALVVAEIVASIVLLVSTGLLIRALWHVQATDLGFTSDGVLTLETSLSMPKYESEPVREKFYAEVLRAVRALPGVSSAGYISFLPIVHGGGIFPVGINGVISPDRSLSEIASLRYVSPGLFKTLGIPLRRGRDVTESDTSDRPRVAIVSESFVRRYWPDQDPIGRHFLFVDEDREVVGVVGDIHMRGLERSSEPQAWLPYRQLVDTRLTWYAPKDLVVRMSGGAPAALVPPIRAIIRHADPQQPISDVQMFSDIIEGETAWRSVQVQILIAFAAIAFVLAAVGIHGVLSFLVSARAHEFSVRVALGAQSSDILGIVVKRSLGLTMAGLVPGIALAYAAGQTLQALLAGVTPSDPTAFAAAVTLCALMTLIGTLLPTVRALRIDPIRALRSE